MDWLDSTRATLTRLIFNASARNRHPFLSISFASRFNVLSVFQGKVGLSMREKEHISAFTRLIFDRSLRWRTPSISTLLFASPSEVSVSNAETECNGQSQERYEKRFGVTRLIFNTSVSDWTPLGPILFVPRSSIVSVWEDQSIR